MRIASLLIGMALLAIGAAGFIPAFTTDGLLFGMMPNDTLRSVLFAATGLVGIAIGTWKRPSLTPSRPTTGQDMRSWM